MTVALIFVEPFLLGGELYSLLAENAGKSFLCALFPLRFWDDFVNQLSYKGNRANGGL
jgi:hypothetical protein